MKKQTNWSFFDGVELDIIYIYIYSRGIFSYVQMFSTFFKKVNKEIVVMTTENFHHMNKLHVKMY